MIEYTDEQHDSLIRGHRKQLADAQATVGALQRDRLREALDIANETIHYYSMTAISARAVGAKEAIKAAMTPDAGTTSGHVGTEVGAAETSGDSAGRGAGKDESVDAVWGKIKN